MPLVGLLPATPLRIVANGLLLLIADVARSHPARHDPLKIGILRLDSLALLPLPHHLWRKLCRHACTGAGTDTLASRLVCA